MIGDDPTVMKQILSQALLLEGKKQDVNKDGKVDINDVIAAMSSNGKILPFAAQAASQIAEFKSEKMV